MRKRLFATWAAACFVALLLASSVGAQHGPTTDHLVGTGAFGNVQLVSKLKMHDAEPETIADLTVLKNYAYLSKWGATDCAGSEKGGQNTPDGGAYVVDISNLASPREVGFIATSQDTLVGEGMPHADNQRLQRRCSRHEP